MILEMPCRTDALYYDFTAVLEGKAYQFTFRWNDRGAFWTMSIADGLGIPLISGRRVVVDWPLLFRFPFPALPPGEFFASDPTGRGDPAQAELGGRVKLYYVEAIDMGAPRGTAQ